MKRILLSGLGAVILFVWGFAGHVVLRMYDSAFQGFATEAAVVSAVEANAPRGGLYYLPLNPARDAEPQAGAFVNYVPAGDRSGFGAMVIRSLTVSAIAVFLVLTLLSSVRWDRYWAGVARFALAGVIVSFPAHAYFWNWFDFPLIFMSLSVLDALVGWTLVGLVLARLMRPA